MTDYSSPQFIHSIFNKIFIGHYLPCMNLCQPLKGTEVTKTDKVLITRSLHSRDSRGKWRLLSSVEWLGLSKKMASAQINEGSKESNQKEWDKGDSKTKNVLWDIQGKMKHKHKLHEARTLLTAHCSDI